MDESAKLAPMKDSSLSKRLKELEKELSHVDGNIRSLSRTLERPRTPGLGAPPASPPPEAPSVRREPVPRRARDERFTDYLASSLEPTRPLLHERRLQRNKAILALVVTALVLFWILHRLML